MNYRLQAFSAGDMAVTKVSLSLWAACIALAGMAVLAVSLIFLVSSVSPRSGFVNCSMVSFHPDFNISVRQACQKVNEAPLS